jgi:anti-anti-sigma regulatory factor
MANQVMMATKQLRTTGSVAFFISINPSIKETIIGTKSST